MAVNKDAVQKQLKGLDPAEVQEWINIAIEFLVEITTQRGMTGEQLRARRKQIIAEELAVIAEEKAKLPLVA